MPTWHMATEMRGNQAGSERTALEELPGAQKTKRDRRLEALVRSSSLRSDTLTDDLRTSLNPNRDLSELLNNCHLYV